MDAFLIYLSIGAVISPFHLFLIYSSEKYLSEHPELRSPFSKKPLRFRLYATVLPVLHVVSILFITPYLSYRFTHSLVNLVLNTPSAHDTLDSASASRIQFNRKRHQAYLDEIDRRFL